MEIQLYSEPGCAACEDARRFLISHGIPYQERDIRAHSEYCRIMMDVLESRTTPTLVVHDEARADGDTVLVGFDAAEYEALAQWLRVETKKFNA